MSGPEAAVKAPDSERVDQAVNAFYNSLLARRGYNADASQLRAVGHLQRLYEDWHLYKEKRASRLLRLITRPALPRGVYLWGSVGRGKSFLMDGAIRVTIKEAAEFVLEFMDTLNRFGH